MGKKSKREKRDKPPYCTACLWQILVTGNIMILNDGSTMHLNCFLIKRYGEEKR